MVKELLTRVDELGSTSGQAVFCFFILKKQNREIQVVCLARCRNDIYPKYAGIRDGMQKMKSKAKTKTNSYMYAFAKLSGLTYQDEI